MSNVLLDGELVAPETIDPAKHRFLGTFRPAENPLRNAGQCPCCGVILNSEMNGRGDWNDEHWRAGHVDIPQYVTIKGQD